MYSIKKINLIIYTSTIAIMTRAAIKSLLVCGFIVLFNDPDTEFFKSSLTSFYIMLTL